MQGTRRLITGIGEMHAEMLASGQAKGIASIRNIFAQKPAPDPRGKRENAFFGAFARMGELERAGVLQHLAVTYPRDIAAFVDKQIAQRETES